MKLFDLLVHLQEGGKVKRESEQEVVIHYEQPDGYMPDHGFYYVWMKDSYRTPKAWVPSLESLMATDWVAA